MAKKLLLFSQITLSLKRIKLKCFAYPGLLFLLLFFCSQSNNYAQEVDNWYSADRAINSPSLPSQLHLFTPFAPADGTPVSVWHELVDFFPEFTQDAMEHPNPLNYDEPWENYPNHGFEIPQAPGFLTPVGAIPGTPTLERSVMNFNPAVDFDGSGPGDALYFRSHARGSTVIIVVFKALGEGTGAVNQSLLFGGDIENHLSDKTNLSLGISDGNRFSIGRTSDDGNEYFQAGTIDLLGRPSIGVFIRDSQNAGVEHED